MTLYHFHPAHYWRRRLSIKGRVHAWIVIEAKAWELLQQQGELTCSSRFARPGVGLERAYDWMRSQMTELGVAPPISGLTPWWFWVGHYYKHPEPFFNELAGMHDPVVLELRLPAESVALSCFDSWLSVVNDNALSGYEDEGEAYELIYDDTQAAQYRRESWRYVFDLGRFFKQESDVESLKVQGCTWVLDLNHVIGVIPTSKLDLRPKQSRLL